MILELNEVLLEGEPHTLSLMAKTGQLTCLTGGTPARRLRWLRAMQGFERICNGFISIDGEPLTPRSASVFRQLIAYAPQSLPPVGEVDVLPPPSVQDIFNLKANRERPISNGILAEEMRRIAGQQTNDDPRTKLLAVAVLLGKPILLVDTPSDKALPYLLGQATTGKAVIVATEAPAYQEAADSQAILIS